MSRFGPASRSYPYKRIFVSKKASTLMGFASVHRFSSEMIPFAEAADRILLKQPRGFLTLKYRFQAPDEQLFQASSLIRGRHLGPPQQVVRQFYRGLHMAIFMDIRWRFK
jgi:hypothetical protein